MKGLQKSEKHNAEVDAIKNRYAARGSLDRYAYLNNDVYMNNQERERRLIGLLKKAGLDQPENMSVLDLGSGWGHNFLLYLKLGFSPGNMRGIELLDDRCRHCEDLLSPKIEIIQQDALSVDLPPNSVDIVSQFVVFSSVLDDDFQSELASQMWRWVKPGGSILWYDFVYNNPRNKDVRGVPLKRVRALFPEGKFVFERAP